VVALDLYPLLAALAGAVLVLLAEWLHARRVRRVALLAFGPSRRPAFWARAAAALRVLAAAALAWGLATLALIEPKRYSIDGTETLDAGDYQHVLLVLDVSPSMRLVDAGAGKDKSRMQRARELMDSFFERVPIELYRVSVVATYNGAKPVVVDTTDYDVVRNILGDLPMHYAFPAGKTKIFDGLAEAAELARPWNPGSTILILLTDGDTVPATGMPRLPASVRSTLVVGVGDARTGKFIDGRQSRQDVPTLKQIAARLKGTFHNGNEKHLASSLIASATGIEADSAFDQLTRREYALIACALGASILALLPLALHFFGTSWRPGASPVGPQASQRRASPSRPSALVPAAGRQG
jgi:Ca-activated chloride channel family protein